MNSLANLLQMQWNPDFSKLSAGKGKLVRKITVFGWGEGNDFGFEFSWGSRNWDSTVVILKPRIVYSMTLIDSLVISKTYKRNTSSPYEKFKKIFKRRFVEPSVKNTLFRATTKKQSWPSFPLVLFSLFSWWKKIKIKEIVTNIIASAH